MPILGFYKTSRNLETGFIKLNNSFDFNPVQNCDGSEPLPYLQANKLACHSYMGTSGRQETAGSDKSDHELWCSKQYELHACISSPCPQVPRGWSEQPRWMLHA